ncbi:MAG: endonuclease/exonuclease/phosphatase family protein [Bacteroidia bacterium]|nr:endonuclease/exonuclease/phosphatase family protein [Bacteroidia bacterium]
MTFNIRSAEPNFIAQPYIDLIEKYKPDLISFQEVEVNTSRVGKKDIIVEIASKTGMFPLFAPAYKKDIGKYGVAMLSRYPITKSNYSALPKLGSDPRVVLFSEIILPSGFKTKFISVHLDHRTSDVTKLEEAKALYSSSLFTENMPIVLAGDFNMFYMGPISLKLQEFYDKICNNDYTFEYGDKLDYIFAYPKGKWKILSTSVLYETGKLSDHFPVFSEIEYTP